MAILPDLNHEPDDLYQTQRAFNQWLVLVAFSRYNFCHHFYI